MRKIFIIIYFSAFCNTIFAQVATYDALGRVIQYAYSNDTVIRYTFDAVGNRTRTLITRAIPDLAVQSATLNGVIAANMGETIALSVNVANIGARSTRLSSGLRVLLSTDCTVSSNDNLLYQTTIPVLETAAIQSLNNVSLRLPSNIAIGNYKILVVADTSNVITELDESNNIACLPLQITQFTCNMATNFNFSNASTTSATITWTGVTGVSSYNLRYRVFNASTWSSNIAVSGTSYGFVGLMPNTVYEYQVQTICNGDNSEFSTSNFFSTLNTVVSNTSGFLKEISWNGMSWFSIENFIKTSDNNFIVTGRASPSLSSAIQYAFYMKLDQNGQILYCKIVQSGDCPRILAANNTGGALMVVRNMEDYGLDYKSQGLIDINADGSIRLQKICTLSNNFLYAFRHGIRTTDGGFLLTGAYYGNQITIGEVGTQETQPIIVKVDQNLNLVWSRNYNGQTIDFYRINPLADGNFLVFGSNTRAWWRTEIENQDLVLMKIDGNGNILWSKKTGLANYQDQAGYINLIEKNGYIYMAGASYTIPNGPYVPRLYKINGQNGLLQWAKVPSILSSPGYLHFDSDGNMLCFESNYIYKFDENGNIIWSKKWNNSSMHSAQKTSTGYFGVGVADATNNNANGFFKVPITIEHCKLTNASVTMSDITSSYGISDQVYGTPQTFTVNIQNGSFYNPTNVTLTTTEKCVQPSTIVINSPNNGTFIAGNNIPVFYTSTNITGNINVELVECTGTSAIAVVGNNVASTGLITYTLPQNLATGTYRIKVYPISATGQIFYGGCFTVTNPCILREIQVDTSILAGASYVFNNHTYVEGGTYRDTFRTPQGCDSIVITNLRLRSNPCAPVPTSGRVAYYPFNGNANDESGNGNHGTAHGPTLTTDHFGKPNSAYLFNGVDNNINIPNSLSLQTCANESTMSVWFTGNAWYGGVWLCLLNQQGQYQVQIFKTNVGISLSAHATELPLSVSNLNLNQWYHLVVTHKSGVLKAYLDGILVGSAMANPRNGATGSLHIGYDPEGAIEYHTGKIDDILIYNRALSHAEIVNLYGHQGIVEIRRDTTLCMGKSVQVGTHRYTQTGLYRDTLQNGGCDTIVITNLTITPPQSVRIDTSICANKTLIINGRTYRQAGNYQDTLRAGDCINQVWSLTLRLNPLNTRTQNLTLCAGDSVQVGNRWLKTAGTSTDTLFAQRGGCDTVRTTNLQLAQPVTSTQFLDLCEGDSLRLHNRRWIYTGGTFRDTLRGQNDQGCDSMVISVVTLKPASRNTLRYTICQGNAVTVGGLRFDQAGVHTIKVPNDVGCDSILTLYLQVHPTRRDTIRAVLCQGSSYLFGNQTITQAGTYTLRLRTVFNCDSTVVLILRVNAPVNRPLDTSICEGTVLRIAHYQHRTTGIYRDTIRDINGCDSIRYVVNLTVHPLPVLTVITPTICEGSVFTQRNHIYRITGIYRDTFPNFRGCDSVVETRLTVYPRQRSTQVLELCVGDSIWLHNRRWVQLAGTSLDTLRNFLNCDSIVTTIIQAKPTSQTTQRISICQGGGVTVGDRRFTETGIYTIRLSNYVGCDSVITLYLQVNPVKRDTIRHSICQGSSYLFGNQLLTQSGTYPLRLRTVFNCDSTIILILNVIPPITRIIDTSFCAGGVLNVGNFQHRTTGNFTDTLRSQMGCDSVIVQVHLRVFEPSLLTQIRREICQGDSVRMGNQSYYTTGIHRKMLVNRNGCDSLVELNLTVHPLPQAQFVARPNFNVVTFENSSTNALRYFWRFGDGDTSHLAQPTHTYRVGTYQVTLFVYNNCGRDSLVIPITVRIPSVYTSQNKTICYGKTFVINNHSYNTTGSYIDTTRSIWGGDTILTTNLTVLPALARTIRVHICQGAFYQLRDGRRTDTAGTFLSVIPITGSCDSLITTIVTVQTIRRVTVDTTICNGSRLILPDNRPADTTGIYESRLRTVAGCDSFIILTRLTVLPFRTRTDSVAICEGYSYTSVTNRTYRQAGTHWDTLRNRNCDTLRVKTVLSIKPTITRSVPATICQGATYRLPDGQLTDSAGTYRSTLRGNGIHCDTIVTTTLTVERVIRRIDSAQICENGVYIFLDGRTTTRAGIYTTTLFTRLGCDSLVVKTYLRVYALRPPQKDTVTICYNSSYRLPDGRQVSTPGDYTSTIRSFVVNCDSVIVLTHLKVTQRALLPARPISTAGLGSNEIRFTFNNLDTNFRYTLHFGDSSQQMIRLGDTVWHHYQRDGDYQVQLIMEAPCSRDTFRVNMPIFTPLRVRLVYPKVVCEGDSVRYQYIVQSGAITNQFWNLQNGTPNFSLSPAPVVTYRIAGKWQVKLTVQNTLNSLELIDSIVVKPRTRAHFNYGIPNAFTVHFTQTATNATTYRWEFGDGNVSQTLNPIHNYNQAGDFTVLLIVSNDCNRDTMRQVIHIGKTLTENLQFVNRFKLMPNPAQDELTIQLELKIAQKITFRLLNLLGQEQMKLQPAMAKTFEQSFDVSGLANGSYLLQIMGENGLMINEKVVIQH